MSSLNRAQLIGRLGADPEVRNFQNGGKVVNLRLATSERWKDKDGNQQDRTEWHAVAIFNDKIGDVAERYLRKGSLAYIEGQIETRKWTDKDGNDRYSTEIVLRPFRGAMVLLDSKGGGASADTPAAAPRRAPAQPSAPLDDEIPF